MVNSPVTVDYETEPIEPYPHFPPKPVGVSLWYPGKEEPKYLAWGHPSENNCTFEQARAEVGELKTKGVELLYHHGRFDRQVEAKWLDLPWPDDPLIVHDTLYLNFLYDATADSLSLKPSAERILGMPPDEKDELDDWLKAHGLQPGRDICLAPGGLVGRYANGDTRRTRFLYDHLLPEIQWRGMLAAYHREQRLAPILAANERDGIRINLEKLQRDLNVYEKIFTRITEDLLAKVGSCNPDSSGELAAALLSSGYARESDFKRTPTGRLSVSKDSIAGAVKDPLLVSILGYRGHLKTQLTTFMRVWAAIGAACGGRLHPQFHQVRGPEYGARTGRMSSSDPNFQNVITEFKSPPPPGYPELPFMREYVLPDDDSQVIVSADFRSQEFRIAAHFAEGKAAEIYRNDPKADFHLVVSDIIQALTGMHLPRKLVKIIGFTILYGGGVGKLAESLGVDRGTASKIKSYYFQALPGMKELMEDVASRGRKGLPVRTWGGRQIFAEPPREVKGQWWDFSYKLVNYLIQGSAADQTKESIIEVGYQTPHRRFLASVHDENVYSVDRSRLREEVATIRTAMEKPDGWDVPWKTEVNYGPNWWVMEELE